MLVTGVAFLFLVLLGVVGAEPGTNASPCKESGAHDTTYCKESATNSPAMLQKTVMVHQQGHRDDEEKENAGCEKQLLMTVRSFDWSSSYSRLRSPPNYSEKNVSISFNGEIFSLNKEMKLEMREPEMGGPTHRRRRYNPKIWSPNWAELWFGAQECCPEKDLGEVFVTTQEFYHAAGFEGKVESFKSPLTVNLTIRPNLWPIKVKVRSATNLPSKDFWGGKSDAFVRINSGCDQAETRHVMDNNNPVWDQSFNLQWKVGSGLEFQVVDEDKYSGDDKIGDVLLQADEFNLAGIVGKKLKLPGSDALLEVDVTLL